MATTIQISNALMAKLKNMKMYDKESYEDIIWDMLEDRMELSAQTKLNIEESRKQIASKKVYTHEQVKKELGI
jgi:predicted CopG family antitoxin